MTTDTGIEPIGNQDFGQIGKNDHGFDWDNRTFLVSEDYQPEWMLLLSLQSTELDLKLYIAIRL